MLTTQCYFQHETSVYLPLYVIDNGHYEHIVFRLINYKQTLLLNTTLENLTCSCTKKLQKLTCLHQKTIPCPVVPGVAVPP